MTRTPWLRRALIIAACAAAVMLGMLLLWYVAVGVLGLELGGF